MRVQKDDETGGFYGFPHGVKSWIIQPIPYSLSTHDQAPQMREGGNLVDNF